MGKGKIQDPVIEVHPLTSERWQDFEALFGPNGAVGGCWCMWWRLPHAEFERRTNQENYQAMKDIVESGEVPGLLAYDLSTGGQPVGWCALAPRQAYPALDRSPLLNKKKVDDQPVWSIVCFYIHRRYRRHGLSLILIEAAIDYARLKGAQILEAYPIDPGEANASSNSAYTGLASAFVQCSFVEVTRRSPTRPILRYTIN
jgi:GNAT superfamily N-acetyltransferase